MCAFVKIVKIFHFKLLKCAQISKKCRGKRGSKYEVELKDESPVNREKKLVGSTFCTTKDGIWAFSEHKIMFYAFRNNVTKHLILTILDIHFMCIFRLF